MEAKSFFIQGIKIIKEARFLQLIFVNMLSGKIVYQLTKFQ